MKSEMKYLHISKFKVQKIRGFKNKSTLIVIHLRNLLKE